MLQYPIVMTPDDNDTIVVSFPDFPEAHTFGDDEDEAKARAVDALATVIDAYIRDRREIPAPSVRRKATYVALPALMGAKVELYNRMKSADIRKAELARRCSWHLPQVDRVLDVRHATRLDQLERAVDAVGMDLVVELREKPTAARPPTSGPRRAS